MFQSNIAKGIILGLIAAAAGVGFVTMNLNSQNGTCHEAGFGDYDDESGTCKVNGAYASNLVIVAGNTANTPKPQFLKDSTTYDYVKNSIASHASIKVVSAATDMSTETVEISRNETNDAEGYIESIDKAMADLEQKISQIPKSDGATYYEAISRVGRDAISSKPIMANSTSNDDGAAVIVIGSGLSDGGALNFADGDLLSKDTNDIVSAMEKTSQLKSNLAGLRTIWSGIGQTMDPQPILPDHCIDKVKEIYTEIFAERGVNIVFDEKILPSEDIEGNNFTVKPTMPWYEFGDEELKFDANRASISDRTVAKNALANMMDNAKKNPSRKIIITGYMAAGGCDSQAKNSSLARQRAETVRDFLKENGVTNDIEALDGGIFDKDKSECVDGEWKPELANYRRKVTIRFK